MRLPVGCEVTDGVQPLPARVSEEAFDRVNGDRPVELAPIACALARMIADPPCTAGIGLSLTSASQASWNPPSRVRKPSLYVFAGRTGVVAGREEVEIDRPLAAQRAGWPLRAEIRRTSQVYGLFSH